MPEDRALARVATSAPCHGFTVFYLSKWVSFSCATVLMLSAGLQYAFSVYGRPLKHAVHLSNSELSMLGAFSNAGGYSAILAGLFYDYVKRYKRIGPFICASVGALCYAVGFGGLYAAATGRVAAPFPVLCALAYLASNGGTWLEAAAVATCVRNFETERGSVVGILKAFLGLSASLYTTLYMTLCTQPLQFLKLLAIVPTGVALVGSLGVNAVPFRQLEPHSKAHAFHMSMNATVSLAAYQLVSALYFKLHNGSHRDHDVGWTMCAAVLCLLMPILTLPGVFGGLRALPLAKGSQPQRQGATPRISLDASNHGPGAPLLAAQASTAHRRQTSSRGAALHPDGTDEGFLCTDKTEATLLQCMRMLDFWLLTFAAATTTGMALVFINNASALVESLGGDSSTVSVVVSIFSVANCLGRMSTAFSHERLFGKRVPRTHFLVISCFAAAAAALLDAYATVPLLPWAAAATGLTFGYIQALAPTITSELFGLAHFATNTAFVSTMFIVTSFAMANGMSSWIYRAHIRPPHRHCLGPGCFRLSFLVCTVVGVAAGLASLMLTTRRVKYYRRMTKALQREREKRGTNAIQYEQRQELRRMTTRLDRAATALMRTHAQRESIATLRSRLTGGARDEHQKVLEQLEAHMEDLEGELHSAQEVLEDEWVADDESQLSHEDSASFSGSFRDAPV